MKIFSKVFSLTLAVLICSSAGASVSAGFVDTDEGTRYETSDDVYLTNRRAEIDGNTYYFDGSGIMRTGLLKLKSGTYYFDDSGVMQTGLQKIGGAYYYFDENGVMRTGLQKVGRFIYDFGADGRFVSKPDGWITLDDGVYYCEKGMMRKGIITLKDGDGGQVQYYFDETGKMVTDTLADYKLQTLYIGADGKVYRIVDNTSSKRRELNSLKRNKSGLEEDIEKYEEKLESARKSRSEALSDYEDALLELENAKYQNQLDNTIYDDNGNAVYVPEPDMSAKSVSRAQKKAERCREKYDKYTQKVTDINKDIADARSELKEINSQISALEKLFKEAGIEP